MKLYLLKFNNLNIYEQLLIEEALLRTDDRNFCIINDGSPNAIVLGISSSVEKFVDHKKAQKNNIPLIQRYSGGGTVFVDSNTVFVSFIINKEVVNDHLFPEAIHKWAEKIYKDVFNIDGFALKENDYVIKDKKFGGNAQYIKKNRCVHHTTFLWDFEPENMNCLLLPPKIPNYRKQRNHLDFLTSIRHHFESKKLLIKALEDTLSKHFISKEVKLDELDLEKEHRKSTKKISRC